MGTIRLGEHDGQPVFLTRYLAPLEIAINLQEHQWMELAVKFAPGAKAEELPERLPSSWSKDDSFPGDFQSRLTVNAANVLALHATGFTWDEPAKQLADQFPTSPESIAIVRHACEMYIHQIREFFGALHAGKRNASFPEEPAPRKPWFRHWF